MAKMAPEAIEEQMTEAVGAATKATTGKTDEERQAAVQGAIHGVTQQVYGKETDTIYLAAVYALIAFGTIALLGLVWSILDGNKDTSADPFSTIFLPILTGIIGLFAKSPSQN